MTEDEGYPDPYDEIYDEYPCYFAGTCTCEHEDTEHTWGSCGIEECEAGWEE